MPKSIIVLWLYNIKHTTILSFKQMIAQSNCNDVSDDALPLALGIDVIT